MYRIQHDVSPYEEAELPLYCLKPGKPELPGVRRVVGEYCE
jgi:hypothetical protein